MLTLLACAESEVAETDITPAACLGEDRPAGWTETAHSREAAHDYDLAFDRSTVLELHLTVGQTDYEASLDELESLLGESGGAGPGEGAPPDLSSATAACSGLGEGDACVIAIDGVDTDGACAYDGPQGELVCIPSEGGGESPPLDFTAEDPSYFEAFVEADGLTWCWVGMRWKGNSTLTQTWMEGNGKLPFRLDFDEFEADRPSIEDQRFYGFTDLSFGNGQGDATYARDQLASTLLEDRGVPAARNRFAAVWLDQGEGEHFLGLYTMAEDPSDELPDRVFGDEGGVLYEADGECATLECYDEASFEAKTHEDEATGAEVQALIDALAADRSDAETWRAGVEASLDVEAWIRWLAMNAAMENWDSYGTMAHNYYLLDVDGRLAWIPWDHNLSLMDAMEGTSDPLLADVDESWPLIRHVLDDELWGAHYREELAASLEGAWAAEAFEAAAADRRALAEPWALAEEDGYGFVEDEAAWEAGWEELLDHAEARRAEVAAALED